MSLSSPQWLVEHGGSLKLGSDGVTWFVLLGEQPDYSLRPLPTAGKIGCAIRQTINGRTIASVKTFPTQEEAIQNGFEDLRKDLGW